MSTEHPDDLVSIADQNLMIFAAIGLPLARLIQSRSIDPATVSRDELTRALMALGHTHEDAFEIHLTQIEEVMPLVANCISQGRPRFGVVLLFTLIEAEVNSLIRILLRVRNYSASKITNAVKGTSFDTKLDVLLPLLEVEVPEGFRNAALQCKSIRNVVAHNKSTPALMADIGNKKSDDELADERSEKFFSENPIERFQTDLEDFVELSIIHDPAMQLSAQLFEKYFKKGL